MGFFDGVASAVVGGALGLVGGSSDNKASAKAAAAANEFTERQLKNRHQWEVQDLRAAGLNPILSSGATPSIGHSAQAQVFPKSEAISKGVNSALAARQLSETLKNIRADTSLKVDQAAASRASAIHSLASARQASNTADWSGIKAGMARVITDRGSRVASSAAGAARQVPRYLSSTLPRQIYRSVRKRFQ